MGTTAAILLPPAVLAFATGVVALLVGVDRLMEVRARGLNPQQLATAWQMNQTLRKVQSNDHLRNLFEMPVLFYVLCGYLAITNQVTGLLVALAWLYVALRAVHGYIHLTHNTVLYRFSAFFASTLVLYTMWILFLVELLG